MTNAKIKWVALVCCAALTGACDDEDSIGGGGDSSAMTDGGPDSGGGPGGPPPEPGDGDGDGDGDGESDSGDGDGDGDSGDGDSDSHSPIELPDSLYNYANPDLPAHFRTAAVEALDNTPNNNPVTDAGATLGRVLFYDTALSQNETISCASCHEQSTGFSDTLDLSEGFEGGLTGRNSMGLSNSRYYAPGHFFWDERAATLEEQVLMPIQDSVEMGLTLEELVARVSERGYYGPLFADAFGDEQVTSDRISRALAQFVRAMVSYQSRFDQGLEQAGDVLAPFANFSDVENQGKALFLGGQARCGVCHLVNAPPQPGQPPALNNQAIFMFDRPSNNGLDANTSDDEGVGAVTGNPQQSGQFKIPSLRNITLTGPYMHDGRFETLAEVLDHYNTGIENHPNLDPVLRGPDNQPVQLNLDPGQLAAIEAFLGTLTDDALLTDPKFSDPFVG